jgi:hypothetical protein
MFSGIASLESKWVKNTGQRLGLLFTGTQKTTNLACDLCTTGWEKDPTPFEEVVEGRQIYNFGIQLFAHFGSKIWRKTRSNRAKQILNGVDRAHARDVARDAGVTHRPAPWSRWTRTLRPASVFRSMRRGPPLRTTIPALSLVATRHARTGGVAPTMPLDQPRTVVRTARRAPMLRPYHDHCGCLAHQGVVDRYKGARAVPLALLHFPRRRFALPSRAIEGRRRASRSVCLSSKCTPLALALGHLEARTPACCPGRAAPSS